MPNRLTPKQAAPLFAGWPETPIYSCLSGTMGQLIGTARAAAAVIGDFAFLAGQPDAALLTSIAALQPQIVVPRTEAWAPVITAAYGTRVRRFERYATAKTTAGFDPRRLQQLADPPAGVQLVALNQHWFNVCQTLPWAEDFTRQFRNFDQFNALACGVLALHEGELVAGTSAYSAYPGGIEIEVDTREDYRRRGLATACSAQLILTCLGRGLYPSWDAHTKTSLALAQKLGYQLAYAYPAYLVAPSR
ncbi:GNAT family N-acetyltransferase [Lacticaseibacillus suibinensis]|uniref:GNAT family N-acetyltransferase n=1 Tax=Lacticaseibacillus suibinensis TaxID=2486011 RepID=UPI001944CDDB|nr:GNAT family N-acetyltransferase [Lacticaseibacillus suibinensis]